jgi:hypothetical protein
MIERDTVLTLDQIEIAKRIFRCSDATLIVRLGVQLKRRSQIPNRLIGVPLLEQRTAARQRSGRIALLLRAYDEFLRAC